jgi:hypothetical protein
MTECDARTVADQQRALVVGREPFNERGGSLHW